MKIISIVGARPQFIKTSPLFKEIKKKNNGILVHTGQHYDYEMSKLFFDQLGIPEPDYNLGVGSSSQGEQTGKMVIETEKVLIKEKPDCVLVYGDTNSTLAGVLSAVKLHIKTAHVEAGLRSFDKSMPEEINRVLTDHCSDLLFAPTKTSVENLHRENIKKGVHLTGDVMLDALQENIKLAEKTRVLDELRIKPNDYFLTTIHRQSNTDNPQNLSNLLEALSNINEKVVFPIHPRTAKFIKSHNLDDKIGKNIVLTKPVGYLDFIFLEKNAKKILTDSGGIQKEAYMFKVPCITLRDNTEWIETVEDGWNVLVGTDKQKIINAVNEFQPKGKQRDIFGNGKASKNIVNILSQEFYS
jgi:UDP-N-acetylglucosamine 2-epimerase (non-hydrolysing)